MSKGLPVGLWDRQDSKMLQGVGVLGMSQGLPVGLWDRQDSGMLQGVGVLGMSQGLPVGLWDRQDSEMLQGVGVLGMSQGLPVGLWDRQDSGITYSSKGNPWDIPGTPIGAVGRLQGGVFGITQGLQVGQTGQWNP